MAHRAAECQFVLHRMRPVFMTTMTPTGRDNVGHWRFFPNPEKSSAGSVGLAPEPAFDIGHVSRPGVQGCTFNRRRDSAARLVPPAAALRYQATAPLTSCATPLPFSNIRPRLHWATSLPCWAAL